MNKYLTQLYGYFRFGGSALGAAKGTQSNLPGVSLVEDVPATNVDAALQISAVYRGLEILASVVATMPIMVYDNVNGKRTLARDSALWYLLHESPNSRMTPVEFWTAMRLNEKLRGNAYARIQRNPETGIAEALWPMPADQVELRILDDGSEVYFYRIGTDVAALASENVLHIKGMGNGTIGLSRLDYMRATIGEVKNSQNAANKLFANGGKPTGVLMVDRVLDKTQRAALKVNFSEMAEGSLSRLHVLEADMKYQQINLSPEDLELLSTRKYSVEELGRWLGIPGILLNQTEGTTTLGSSSGDIIDSFYKLTVRPDVTNIEQAIRKRVMTSAQRVRQTAEYNMDALLRASLKDRVEIYAKQVQNALKNRNEVRQLENDEPYAGGELFTVQSNLLPVDMLGKVKPSGATNEPATIAQ
ncbi:phage portal protein [Methylophilus sp. Leaf414]|uniref:phage portal protein n=1 Tax=Methylophilus sp. Leaf414 TaxID=1736371 RepID=UPI0006FF21DF|nr:phage portal protein [Methylophilus sp. Leaf414]KQT37688.1 hypothetical protein ASG24_01445 [Methylophilus sp. Leaf414]